MREVPFREVTGQLLYLESHTRSDIAVAVSTLSRQASNSQPLHWAGVECYAVCVVHRITAWFYDSQVIS